jgi:hypothetical protein
VTSSRSVSPAEGQPKRSSLGALGRAVRFTLLLGAVALGLSSAVARGIKGVRQTRLQERHQLGSELQQILAVADGTSSLASPAPAAPDTDLGRVSGLVRRSVDRRLAINREYTAELEASGWMKVLDGERLSKDRSLAETREIVRRAKETAAKFRARFDWDSVETRRDIEGTGVSKEMRAGLLAGYAQALPQQARLWSLEERILARTEEIVKLLDSKRGRWAVKAGGILFRSQADVDLFNSHVSELQAAATGAPSILTVHLTRAPQNRKGPRSEDQRP